MEVAHPPGQPKRLHRHAAPVVMVTLTLLVFSASAFNNYAAGSDSRQVLANGLVTRIIRIQPTADGLAKISLEKSAAPAPNAGFSLQSGPNQAGSTAQMLLNLQATPSQ